MSSYLAELPIDIEERTTAVLLEHVCKHVQDFAVRGEAYDWGVKYLAAHGVNISTKTMERKFLAWRKDGSEALLDGRKAGRKAPRSAVKNPRFLSFWRAMVANSQRSTKASYKRLLEMWYAGETIPGYEKNYKRNSLPQGWSFPNLAKLLPPKKELAIYRKGLRQAKPLMAQTFTTRVGSWPLAFVFFDDVWVDRLSYYGNEIDRCFQIGTLDFYTGRRLSYGTKFRHTRKDGTHVYLNGDEMLLVVCDLLMTYGYNAERGTTFVVENGTAAISPELEELLAAMSGGMIRVDRSGMIGAKQAVLGGYGGRAVGNPNHKAHIESWHNLFHNMICYGPGSVGKDRQPPETLHGIIEAEKKLLKHALDLPIDKAARLNHHLPSFLELNQEINKVVAMINARCDHALEGWEECGFCLPEFSLNPAEGNWGPIARVANNPGMVEFVAQLPAACRRLRRMSPDEAWDTAMQQPGNKLRRFTAEQCAMLLTTSKRLRRPLRRDGAKFVWRDKDGELCGQDLWYETRIIDGRGYEREIRYKEDGLTGIVNPFAPDKLFVFDAGNRLLGIARQIQAAPRHDEEAIRRQWARNKKRNADMLEELRTDMAPMERELAGLNEYNLRIMEGEPADPLAIARREVVEISERTTRRYERRAIAETPRRNLDSYGANPFDI